jgi:oxalate---CoA ligase
MSLLKHSTWTHDELNLKAFRYPDVANPVTADSNNIPEAMMAVEEAIASLWQSILPVKQIRLDDDFFELGGNSLTAARLFSQLETRFGRRLQLSAILEASTIRQQAKLLGGSDGEQVPSLVIPLNMRSEGHPLFLIHPIGGNILIYRDLASRLSRPVYGVEANRDTSLPISVEKLAQRYIEAIQTVQKSGPYYLGGYSFGGIIASEMTYQLQKASESVAFVALIDTSAEPSFKVLLRQKRIKTFADRIIRSARHNLRQIRELGVVRYSDYRLTRIAMGVNLVQPYYRLLTRLGRQRAPVQTVLAEAAFVAALKTYNPKKLAAHTLLFRACDSIADHIDPFLGWSGLVDGQFEVYNVPGNHAIVILEPQVRSIADVINATLDPMDDKRSPCSAVSFA